MIRPIRLPPYVEPLWADFLSGHGQGSVMLDTEPCDIHHEGRLARPPREALTSRTLICITLM